MIKDLAAMFKPDSEDTLEYAQQVVERSVQLARSQLEVAEGMYSKVSREYRELLASADSSVMLQGWTKVLGSASCCTSEGVAAAFQNAVAFQGDMIQVAQSRVPKMREQLLARLGETPAAGARAGKSA